MELVYVDDGSSDGTAAAVEAEATREPRVRLVRQRRRLGLTEALNRGFRRPAATSSCSSRPTWSPTPRSTCPCCSASSTRATTSSPAGARAAATASGSPAASPTSPAACCSASRFHDLNWIKAFRREVTDGLALRSQWHRYILVMAHHEGYRIGEVKVPYRPREAGRSKFGLGRLPVSAIDVVTLKFLLTFQRKPIIFFGASARP